MCKSLSQITVECCSAAVASRINLQGCCRSHCPQLLHLSLPPMPNKMRLTTASKMAGTGAACEEQPVAGFWRHGGHYHFHLTPVRVLVLAFLCVFVLASAHKFIVMTA
jgi:hypothetical protein